MGIAPIVVALLGPPALPDVDSSGPPAEPAPAEGEELEDDPSWDAPEQDEPPPPEPAPEDVATPSEAAPSAPPADEPPPLAPSPTASATVTPPASTQPTPSPAASNRSEPDGEAEGPRSASAETAEAPEKPEKKKFPFKFFRIGVQGKLMYTHGTSDKNGLFDREKSIEDSIENGMVTMSGAGDLGNTQFGGFAGGFLVDLELFGINAWFDFHKFFTPGGMWSLLAGYDHDFTFAKDRLNLNIGLGFGLQKVFLGEALSELYYDEDNPEAINIGTTGMEMRAMVGLDIKIVGPLYTGPTLMGGYHYLWTANASEVTVEKGLHYSAGWNLSLRFALPP